jgi:hypothetical protein
MRRRADGGTPPSGIPLPSALPRPAGSTAPPTSGDPSGAVPARLGLLPPPEEPDPFDRGPLAGATWQGEIDRAVLWLDALPYSGRAVELGAGIGFWTVLLASRGDVSAYDAREDRLTRARQRLLAHGLKAHLHPRNLLEGPEGEPAGFVLLPFLLSQLAAEPRAQQVEVAHSWLAKGGRLALIDLAPPNLDPSTLEQATSEMLGGRFTGIASEPLGRHLILISAIAK